MLPRKFAEGLDLAALINRAELGRLSETERSRFGKVNVRMPEECRRDAVEIKFPVRTSCEDEFGYGRVRGKSRRDMIGTNARGRARSRPCR